jgi:hypothetical protein
MPERSPRMLCGKLPLQPADMDPFQTGGLC